MEARLAGFAQSGEKNLYFRGLPCKWEGSLHVRYPAIPVRERLPKPPIHPMKEPKLEDQLRDAIRQRHYSIKTEEAYVMWYEQFVRFHHLRHPKELAEAGITAFLKHLSVEREVAVETHRQALNAILFLYRHVHSRGQSHAGGGAQSIG